MGFSLVGLALGFEFGAEGGDIEDGFVPGLLESLLALCLDGCDVEAGFVVGSLKALVAVVPDVGEVDVEVLEGGDPCLFI
jgi:hypothetical protein